VEGESLVKMAPEDLVAERIAIDSCREIIRYLAGRLFLTSGTYLGDND
jgi:hypothetical protein